MKNLLILAIISQLCIYVNTIDPSHRDDNKICDFVGTHTDLTPTFVQRRTKQCICNPGFYGHRCEKIYKCRSGRPINISCVNPEEHYALHSELRCIRGQIDLEVCECFVGYTGFLCQTAEVILNPEYANLQAMEHGVVHDGSDKVAEDESNVIYARVYESFPESHTYSDSHNDPVFKLVILPFLLLILFCLWVEKMWRLFNCRKSTEKYISVSTIPVPDSESAPPPYHQVEQDLVKSYYSKRESSRTSSESSDEVLPMPPSLRPYLHV